MRRSRFSVEEKLAIVLEGIRGGKVAEICRRYGISQTMYYRWRDRFLVGGERALREGRSRSARERELEARVRELERMVGKLTLENETLKKTIKWED